MFYFAMENAAACEGYMTEKVWMALSRGSIPIYMGASSIGDMMPTKNSYIDIRDYDSIDALVEELGAIARDEQKCTGVTPTGDTNTRASGPRDSRQALARHEHGYQGWRVLRPSKGRRGVPQGGAHQGHVRPRSNSRQEPAGVDD